MISSVPSPIRRVRYVPSNNSAPPSIFTDSHVTTPYDNFPNFGASPNIWSVQDGLWSSTSTWNLGRIPIAGDVVAILGNVTYDISSSASLKCVVIENNSKLQFVTNANTKIKLQHFMVLEGGELRIGNDATPVDATKTAEVVFANVAIDSNDPSSLGNGLVCFGTWTMCGGDIPAAFIRLTANPTAGATTLSLATAATGWRVGDEVAIPDTHQLTGERYPYFDQYYVSQNEIRTITAISGDLKTLTLSSALSYNHLGYVERNNSTSIYPHVALLTRNIRFYSENASGVRGHTIATMTADVNICHTAFIDMGRTRNEDEVDSTTFNPDGTVLHQGTNQIGRYPGHIHHAHGGMADQNMVYRYMIEGCCFYRSTKWGLAIHNSHYGYVYNNVIWDVKGAGMAFEDGSESYNVVDSNFVGNVRGTGDRGNDGRAGIGMWFRGPNNYIRNNVTVNCYTFGNAGPFCYGFGITPTFLGNIEVPVSITSMTTITTNSNGITIPEFSNNETYACGSGMTVWWLGTREAEWVNGAVAGTILNLTSWHMSFQGMFIYATQGLTIDGGLFLGDVVHADHDNRTDTALLFSDYDQKGTIIKNCNIRGFLRAIQSPPHGHGETLIKNCSMSDNNTGVEITNGWSVGGPDVVADKSTTIDNCTITLGEYFGSQVPTLIKKTLIVGNNYNGRTLNDVHVIKYQGVNGQNFDIYTDEQDANYITPENGAGSTYSGHEYIGADNAGRTNAYNAAHGDYPVNNAVCPGGSTTIANIPGRVVAV